MWVLFPLGELPAADLVLTSKASLAYYGLTYLWATLLLLTGLKVLHAIHRRSYGWLGSVGFYISLVALVLTFVVGTVEMTRIVSTGAEGIVSYLALIMCFLLLACGSVLLGLAITAVLRDALSYLAGILLAIGVPLGLLFVFMAEAAWDFYFWAGLTVPYGLAWLLLGYALLSARGATAQSSRLT